MIDQNSTDEESIPARNVVVVVFDTKPLGGWMLYFAGFYRKPVISKSLRAGKDIHALAEKALDYLGQTVVADESVIGVRVLNRRGGSAAGNLTVPLPPHFRLLSSPITGEDIDVYQYLFDRSPEADLRVKTSPAVPAPIIMSGPNHEHPTESTIIIASDASVPSLNNFGRSKASGTGWVIAAHDESGAPENVVNGRHYSKHDSGHSFSSNTFETYAIRDALLHAYGLKSIRGTASRIILYSDSTHALRALLDRNPDDALVETIDEIHEVIDGFAAEGITFEARWTKGHADNPWNVIADKMAGIARKDEAAFLENNVIVSDE